MIIPDAVRHQYVNNLLGGLTMHLAGPPLLRLVFHVFVVIVGVLILSGAVNTSIIGANGVMNRLAEDRVLLGLVPPAAQTLRHDLPHHQSDHAAAIGTIVLSGGDVNLLGEAYAFGVVWSFFLKSMGVLVLRFKRHDQEYKTPINFHIGKVEIPVGLIVTTMILGLVAIANLFTKQIATIYGVSFTVALFVDLHRIGDHQQEEDRREDRPAWKNSTWKCGRMSPPTPCMRVRVASWWPCAITAACSICSACWKRPICGDTIS